MKLRMWAGIAAALWALGASGADWVAVALDKDGRLDMDRARLAKAGPGAWIATSRLVLTRPVLDGPSGKPYRMVEVQTRLVCATRAASTQRRAYLGADEKPVREERPAQMPDMPVRTGSVEDKLLRATCNTDGKPVSIGKVAEAAAKAFKDLSAAKPEAVRSARRETAASRPAPQPPAPVPLRATWSYRGEGGPEHWGALRPEWALCAKGARQSPIDLREGVKVDMPALDIDYRPTQFRIVDTGHTVQVAVGPGSSVTVQGRRFELARIDFHHPGEERVDGRAYPMSVHLEHADAEGRLAVIALLVERGDEHATVQTLWNHLPLERQDAVQPPNVVIDPAALLPADRRYYAYMGSLTTPPCSEGVLWLVIKQPVRLSDEQIAIFARLYPDNARPLQQANARLIKESR